MKRTHIRNALIIMTVLIFTGAGIVLAHDGWGGRGNMMGYGGGYGGHMMGYGGPMMGQGNGTSYGDLSQEDANKLEAARETFFDQTRELRENMNDKGYAIQKELDQPAPDRDKLKALQDDLSQLRSQFDAYALDYNLAVQGIVPNEARSRAYAGGYRGGNCW
jgi:Spy/CpxP family protein refolding chaperone